jgi:hypothetical protein
VVKFTCSVTDHELVVSCGAGAPVPGDPVDECAAAPNTGKCV